ncbi:Mis18 domain-containing protein [Entamoeba marina]
MQQQSLVPSNTFYCNCHNITIILSKQTPEHTPPRGFNDCNCSANGIIEVKYNELVSVIEIGDNCSLYNCLLCGKVTCACFNNNDIFVHQTCQCDSLKKNSTYQVYLPQQKINPNSKDYIHPEFLQTLKHIKQQTIDSLFQEKENRIRRFIGVEEELFDKQRAVVNDDFQSFCDVLATKHLYDTTNHKEVEINESVLDWGMLHEVIETKRKEEIVSYF